MEHTTAQQQQLDEQAISLENASDAVLVEEEPHYNVLSGSDESESTHPDPDVVVEALVIEPIHKEKETAKNDTTPTQEKEEQVDDDKIALYKDTETTGEAESLKFVQLTATWKENLVTTFSIRRLQHDLDHPALQFVLLQQVASQQFQLPVAALSFSPDDNSGSSSRLLRICSDEDLQQQYAGAMANPHSDTLQLKVDVVLATSICIRYSNNDDVDNENLSYSRHISLSDMKDSEETFGTLMETISETLGTDEFVLTYATTTTRDGVPPQKYLVLNGDQLMDALHQFPGQPLILTPRQPHLAPQNNALSVELTDDQQVELQIDTHKEKEQGTSKTPLMLRLSYEGRDGSSVEHTLESILDTDGQKASYWKLLGLALHTFYLGVANTAGCPPPVCLFYVTTDGSKAEVTSDSYLSELVTPRLSSFSELPPLHIRVEPVVLSISTFSNGVALRHFSLSHLAYNDGTSVSFLKLVRLSRMADPVVGFTYYDLAHVKCAIHNDRDLMNALQQFPRGDLLIRPTLQENPMVLSVRDASLTGKKSKFGSWATPNIMFKSDNAMALWDLSMLVPGRYRVTTQYWRDLNLGPVNVLLGGVLGPDLKTVNKPLTNLHARVDLMTRVNLPASGLNESDFSQAILGEVDVRPKLPTAPPGSETCFLAVAVSPEQTDSPDVFVSNMELMYLGPLE